MGGGTRWLTDTREAYISNRSGAGPFYAGIHWFRSLAYIYYLVARRPKKNELLLVTLLFMSFAYFSGSKSSILGLAVVSFIFYNYFIKQVAFRWYLYLTTFLIAGFAILLFIQGNQVNLISYFQGYFSPTALFISRFDEFGYQYGYGILSSLWNYVPRAIYPDKPWEYGEILVFKVLFPGLAETGNSPGILPWAVAYLDFGIIGVFVDGFCMSIWQRVAFEHFLCNRKKFFPFLFAIQFSLFPLFPFVTTVMTIIIAFIIRFYFRIVLRTRTFKILKITLAGGA